MKKKILAIIAVTALVLSVQVFSAEVKFPSAKGFVNDFAGIIDRESAAKIEVMAKTLKDRKGPEIAIVTINSSYPLEPKEYAVALFKKWGIGEKGKDTGLLFLTCVKERRTEIEVGYGLEGIVTDQFSGRVLDQYLIPNFRQKNYGKGIYETSLALVQRIDKEYNGVPVPKKKTNDINTPILIFLVLIAIIAASMLKLFKKSFSIFFSMLVGSLIGLFLTFSLAGIIMGALIGLASALGGFNGRTGGFGGGGAFGGGFGGGSFGGGGFGGFSGGGSGGGGGGRSW